MGIRKEIKLVIKEYATCTVGANEAINAIANIVSRPKQKKLFPKKINPDGPCPSYEEFTKSEDKCQARQHSDQMFCEQCGIGWDMNDPDPPKCTRKVVTLGDLSFFDAIEEIFKKF